MRSDPWSTALAIAAVVGLSLPAVHAARASAIFMPLCSGGFVSIALGGKRPPQPEPGACHAACAQRRDDDPGGERHKRR